MLGSFTLLAFAGRFHHGSVGVGYTISTVATNQMQAMQMTFSS